MAKINLKIALLFWGFAVLLSGLWMYFAYPGNDIDYNLIQILSYFVVASYMTVILYAHGYMCKHSVILSIVLGLIFPIAIILRIWIEIEKKDKK